MPAHYRQLTDAETGDVLIPRLEMADTLWKQTVGLLGRARLAPDEALWLEPCNAVHTFAMRFPMDLLFLDKGGRALRLIENLRPWRIGGPVRGAKVVVELPAGTIARLGLQAGKHYGAEPASL